jgi:1-acyl-sn-glycerol-3-phosphate acyltransferase
MQRIVIDKPYVPVAPYRRTIWPWLLSKYGPRLLRSKFGVTQVRCEQVERLRESLGAGHGVLLAPNHCRDEDPFVLNALSREAGTPFFIMASWHVFMQSRWQAFLLNRAGAFSIYREGIDRTAVNTAVDILEKAERPLVIFPEGFINRTNDIVNDLLDGTTLIARTAAKRRAKEAGNEGGNGPGKKVVIHPIAIRYHFIGDIQAPANRLLDEIENRLTWAHQRLPLFERIHKVGSALLALKELEYLGEADNGPVAPRLTRLANAILNPLEDKWLQERHDDSVPTRVKRLRTAILPDMTKGDLDEIESQGRWKDLADLYLAQQLYHYPPDYLQDRRSGDRIMETIERLEEDLTDRIRVHGEIHARITVGQAIEVPTERSRGSADPLLGQVRDQLETMLGIKASAGSASEQLASV